MANLRFGPVIISKVLRDLTGSKSRTALIIASIAVGLMAMSTVLRSRAILTNNLDRELAESNQASAIIITAGADDQAVEAVRNLEGIAEAEGQFVGWARLEVGPDEWRSLKLTVPADMENGQIDRLSHESGPWPPMTESLYLERSSLASTGKQLDDTVTVQLPDGRQVRMPISGLVHDLTIVSGQLVDQVTFGYITPETLRWMGVPAGYNQIKLTVTGDRLDPERIEQVSLQATAALETAGYPVIGRQIPEPGKFLMDNVIQSLLLILGALGVLSLVLSAFLLFNTISAVVIRQVPQIGLMKAVGASQGTIFLMFLSLVMVISLLALLVAIPAGMLAARLLSNQMAGLLNFDIESYAVPLMVPLQELGTALVIPLLAALLPIINGTRLTVREALSSQGTADNCFGSGRLEAIVGRLRGLPPSLSYAARNLLRRKARLALTLLALALGGAIFITVLTVRASLLSTVDDVTAYWQQDLTVNFQQPYILEEVQSSLAQIPEVVQTEGWLVSDAFRRQPDGSQAPEAITVFALPPDSHFFQPTLVDGRWLQPGDDNAIVVNIDLAELGNEIAVGEELELEINGQTVGWQIVGLVTSQMIGFGEPRPALPIAYVAYFRFAGLLGLNDYTNRLLVETASHDSQSQANVSRTLETALAENNLNIRTVESFSQLRAQVEQLTLPILLLLISMTFLFALVGGLGLTGTMSLNVLERTREIGVVRALGAPDRTILQIVLVEGVFIGLLSWLLAVLLAYPMGRLMSDAVGINFIKVPLNHTFAPLGIILWLVLIVVLSMLSSYLPARNAVKLVVREALAYD